MSALEKRKAPGPRGHFLTGNLREFRHDVLGLVTRAAAEHGDIVRCRLGPHVIHLLNHPDHVTHVLQRHADNYDKATRSSASIAAVTGESLLTGNGDFWRRQRRMDQPAFHHAQIAGFADQMTACANRMLGRWDKLPVAPLDIAAEMARVTYAIVGSTLFSIDTAPDSEVIERAMRVMLPHLFRRLGQAVPIPAWLPTPANLRFRSSLAAVDGIVYRIIRSHHEALRDGRPDNDLLTLLMQARDPDSGAPLSDIQLRNETITFLLAGHETTANALTWTFHLISKHPDVEERLVAEIRDVLGDRTPRMEDLPQLVFTKQVVQESMRLYPPIWIIERRAIREDFIGGYAIPAGSSVVISPFALHRHPEFWEKPEEFRPERFEEKPPAAYMPFGAGPRFCIGHEFALMEARLILVMVLQRWSLQTVAGRAVEAMPDITLRPKHGLMMELRRRREGAHHPTNSSL
ncbi:MAG: cytochrome P450 [Verrucomicrobiota bacterium]